MSMEKNRDKTIALLNFSTKDLEVVDNPSYKPMVYFGEIAMNFNTFSLLFEPPANKHKIEGMRIFRQTITGGLIFSVVGCG